MRIASWNVYHRNGNIEEIFAFLRKATADVYVLQELSERHVALLERYSDHTFYAAHDFIEDEDKAYLGILTRLSSRDERVVVHNPELQLSPSWIGRHNLWRECIESLSITVDDGDQSVRVVNAHLACAVSPTVRAAQLQEITQHFQLCPRVVLCGDFNAFARPWLNVAIGWLFGFGLRDICSHEMTLVKQFAALHDMHIAFPNSVTFPRFGLQLDNMLLRGMKITTGHVETDTYGSDHRPLFATLNH